MLLLIKLLCSWLKQCISRWYMYYNIWIWKLTTLFTMQTTTVGAGLVQLYKYIIRTPCSVGCVGRHTPRRDRGLTGLWDPPGQSGATPRGVGQVPFTSTTWPPRPPLYLVHTWKKHGHSILAKRYKRKSRKKPKNHRKSHIKHKPHTHHTPNTHILQMRGRTLDAQPWELGR